MLVARLESTAGAGVSACARGLLVLVCAVAGLLFSGAEARGATVHTFSATFGAGVVSAPAGVAVNATTGDVYVADSGSARVEEFSSAGVLVRVWGWGVADGMPELETCTLACDAGIPGSGVGQFETPEFVAVDNSGGSSEGDVYVGDPGDHLITKFTAAGAVVKTWGDSSLNGAAPQGQLDGSSSGSGAFSTLGGIAVDSSGDLDVLEVEPQLMLQFVEEGVFAAEFGTPRGTEPFGLTVNGVGEFFKVNGDKSVEEIASGGGDIGQVSPKEEEGGAAHGVAAAGSDLYIVESGVVRHYAFKEPGVEPGVVVEPAGALCTVAPEAPCPASDSFGSGHLTEGRGVGVDPVGGAVFVTDPGAKDVDIFDAVVVPDVTTGAASEVKPTAATVSGIVDPDGRQLTDCRFEYGTTTGYGLSVPCVPAAGSIPADSAEHAVTAQITGLSPGVGYHFRLRAENASAVPSFGDDGTFSTLPRPAITGAAASSVTASSAQLEADINPGGLATSYHFEYGTSTAYGTSIPIPDASAGIGTSPLPVSVELTGLTGSTTYHWRVVASNEAGVTTGLDHTFVDTESAARGLPDGRAYEIVTPVHKNGSLIGDVPFGGPPPEISEDGSRLISGTVQCFGGAVSCSPIRGSTVGTPYLFKRTSSGWTATPLAPPASRFETNAWWPDSVEAETALFSAPTPPDGEDDFYARNADGVFTDIGPLSPPSGGPSLQYVQETSALAASADLSHLIYLTNEPVWPNSFSEAGTGSLFEYVGAGNTEPFLVGVSGGLGSENLISACGIKLGRRAPGSAGDISADGRVVYFTSQGPCAGTGANAGTPLPVNELFARVDGGEAGAHTVAISEPQARQAPDEPQADCVSSECLTNTSTGDEGAWREALFRGTSSDGSKAFFTSEQQLTDTATEDSNNLYLFDMDEAEGHRLIDASAGAGGVPAAGGPRVQGVLAYSSDGSHVYFVAQGVLSDVANAEGEVAVDGGENLYMFEHDASFPEGHLAFIGVLSEAQAETQFAQEPGDPANVTPDGQFLVFTTSASLTRSATRTDGALQVYRYDAVTGGLLRVSIGAGGFDDDGNGGAGDAMIVPGFKGYLRDGGARPDPTMSNDGSRVFFMSPVALTPGAVASVRVGTGEHGEALYAENVYEWELEGVGSCPPGRGEGCVFLISDGRDTSTAPPEECLPSDSAVCLLGTDASGANVFFTTADSLVPADTDTQLDFYDARICEPEDGNPCISAAPVVLPCSGEACQGAPPVSTGAPSPASSTFSGSGNLTPAPPPAVKPLTNAQKLAKALKVCRTKRNKHKRLVCEAQARRRYPVHKAKKTSAKKSSVRGHRASPKVAPR